MSARVKDEHGVNRLHDIVVEEVSLVDRAANKQRFLIVKRSNDMDGTTTETTTGAEQGEDAQDVAADAVADENTPDASVPGTTPLGSALAALEGLTEAVEILSNATADDASPRLVELAGELGAVSEQLAGLSGPTQPETPTRPGPTEAVEGDPLAGAIASVRTTLARVAAAIEPAPDATEASDESSTNDGVADQLAGVVTELRALTGTVQEQQQRLARLEKRFGLPNSAPSGERSAKTEAADVGWPLDLNRPFDRESVDKAVSFHDV